MNDQTRKNIVYGVLTVFGLGLLGLPFYLYNSTYSFQALDILKRFALHTAAFLSAVAAGTFVVTLVGKAASAAATKMGTAAAAKIGTTVVAPLFIVASGAAVTSYSISKKPELSDRIMQYDESVRPDSTALAPDSLAANVKFTGFAPVVIPRSSLVAAGDEYVADVYIASAIAGPIPDMFYNGQKIAMVEDPITKMKKGQIRFRAAAAAYDASGRSVQTFKTRIDVQGKSYENIVEYTVAKPVIRITSGNVPQLYLNCGNLVNIEVPALGTFYNPTFSATGARIITSEKAGRLTIVPSDMRVTVLVMNDGKLIGTEIFTAKRIPPPVVVCRDGSGRIIDLKAGINVAAVTQLRVAIEPDEAFKENVPRDAVYRVRAMEISLRRGVNFLNTIEVNSENIDLSVWRALLRPGDVIVCNIKNAVRMNYLNEAEIIDIGTNNYQLIPVR